MENSREPVLLGTKETTNYIDILNEDNVLNLIKETEDTDFFASVEKTKNAFSINGTGQIIAIIDSGIRTSNTVLTKLVLASKNFSTEDTIEDNYGHGTLVASIINFIAPGAKIVIAKVADKNGRFSEDQLISAMYWCNTYFPSAINLSLGFKEKDSRPAGIVNIAKSSLSKRNSVSVVRGLGSLTHHCKVCDATKDIAGDLTTVICAVGNERGYIYCPSRIAKKNVLAIGSSKMEEGKYSIADYSSLWPDGVAPEISRLKGTSFSAPLATGCVALLSELLDRIQTTYSFEYRRHVLGRAELFLENGLFEESALLYQRSLLKDSHLKYHLDTGKDKNNCLLCQRFLYPELTGLGVSKYKSKLFDEALGCFLEAKNIAPGFAPAIVNVASALRNLKRFEEAVLEYQRAQSLDPSNVDIYIGLGLCFYESGDYTDSKVNFEKALNIDPINGIALEMLSNLREG